MGRFFIRKNHFIIYMLEENLVNNKKLVQSSELPICPFCQGTVYYESWITHRIFQMECEQCKAHWRTGIKNTPKREMFVELTSSKNPDISYVYLEKGLPLRFWQDLKSKNE